MKEVADAIGAVSLLLLIMGVGAILIKGVFGKDTIIP